MDEEKLEAALLAVSWGTPEGDGGRDIREEVEWLRGDAQGVRRLDAPNH